MLSDFNLFYFNTYVLPEGIEISRNTHKTYKFWEFINNTCIC